MIGFLKKIEEPENVIVYTCGSEIDSAKELGFRTYTWLPTNLDEYDRRGTIAIRWGNSAPLYYRDGQQGDFANVINSSKAGSLNIKKKEALQVMSKVVLTPKIFNKIIPKGKLAVYRPQHHSKGKGFNVVKGFKRIESGNYATSYIPNKKEWRVWFCGDRTLAAIRTTKNKRRLAEKYPVKSLWNYQFVKKVPKKMLNDTLKAAKALGMDFGAMDIVQYRKKFYFLENNSAPALDMPIIEKFYRQGIRSLISKKKIIKIDRKYEPPKINKVDNSFYRPIIGSTKFGNTLRYFNSIYSKIKP